MLNQKRERVMLNILINSHLLKFTKKNVFFISLVLLSLLFSACSVTPQGSSKDDALVTPVVKESYIAAISAMKSGDLNKAQTLLNKLILKNPNISNAHVNLAIIYIQQKLIDKAKISLEQALKLNPNNVYALNQLGIIHRKNGDFSASKNAYEKAISIDSDYSLAYLNLGILYDLYLYDLQNAIQYYKKYQELTKSQDKKVEKWIIDLERRQKKPLALK